MKIQFIQVYSFLQFPELSIGSNWSLCGADWIRIKIVPVHSYKLTFSDTEFEHPVTEQLKITVLRKLKTQALKLVQIKILSGLTGVSSCAATF